LQNPSGSYDFAVNDFAFFPPRTTVTRTQLQKRDKIIDGKIMLVSKAKASRV